MSRSVRLGLATLTVTLLLLPLTLSKPGLPINLKADEGAYYLMALSLARDFDLRLEAEDSERLFEEFPFLPTRNVIVQSEDGWRTVYFSKPLPYPLLAAPFAALFGANGMVLFNMALFLGMVWLGTSYLRRKNGDGLSAVFACAFFFLSVGFVYIFWLQTEVFNMAGITLACYLVFAEPRVSGRLSLLPALTSGAALALVAYNKPMYALLGVALVAGYVKAKQWRHLTSWMLGAVLCGGAVMGLSVILTGKLSPYLGSQQRAGVTLCEPGSTPVGIPRVAPAATQRTAARGQARRNRNWAGLVFQVPAVGAAELWENSVYFLLGRHTGLLLYFPFALVCVLMFATQPGRDPPRWLLLGSLLGVALYFLLWIPVNWQGGGGFVGNRYYVSLYPAFLFLVQKIRPRWLVVIGAVGAGLFLGRLLASPLGVAVIQPTLQAHVRAAPFRLFPLELSLRNLPGYHRMRFGGGRIIVRQDQAVRRNEAFWVRGADSVELWIESTEPLERPTFLVRVFDSRNQVTLQLGRSRQQLEFKGSAAQKVELRPRRASQVRKKGGHTSYVYKLKVTSTFGALRGWDRGLGPPLCASFERSAVLRESFFAGAELLFLGDGVEFDRDIFAVEWGDAESPQRVEPSQSFKVTTRLTNLSSHAWRDRWPGRIYLSYHWLDEAGREVVRDGVRTPLPGDVAAGKRIEVQQEIRAPEEPGRYTLVLDPVYEHVAWFSDRNGGRVLELKVEVEANGALSP